MLSRTLLILVPFLVMVARAQAGSAEQLADTIVDDVTDTEPLAEQVLIYDVTYDESVDDVKKALADSGVSVRHAFQVVGTFRYFLVIIDDGTDALNQLTFPAGSKVTQFPVEHFDDFLESIGAEKVGIEDTSDIFQETTVYLQIEEIFGREGENGSEYLGRLKTSVTAYSEVIKDADVDQASYVTVSAFPLKFFYFFDIDLGATQAANMDSIDAAGGAGSFKRTPYRLKKI